MKRNDIFTIGWKDYALLDCGEGRKLERFGELLLDRPDPQALWSKKKPELWAKAQAHFAWASFGEKWKIEKGVPGLWHLNYQKSTILLSFGKFKHIGVFPEHESQWNTLAHVCRDQRGIKVLNLFGYTGVASLVAAGEGASVTHVDASKQTIRTVKDNIALSNLPQDAIRLICEDTLKYVKRLVQRGETFEVVVMDPPAFGRGPKGEVWKIEEKLKELIELIPKILSEKAKLVILNGYASGYSARSFGEMFQEVFVDGEIVYGDVGIKQQDNERILSTGIYASWQK